MRPGRHAAQVARTATAVMPGVSTSRTASASTPGSASTATASELRRPRSGSGFTTATASRTAVPARTTATTGAQPASTAARTARSSSRSEPTTHSAFGPPIRFPPPAASTAAAIVGMGRPYAVRGGRSGGPLRAPHAETGHAQGMRPAAFENPAALSDALDAAGYLPDNGLATAAFLALRMQRPLFLEGDPGVGKTALAQALAKVTGAELIRLQCYEGIDASQALYDWDFPRQVLHLRAAADTSDREALEASLYDRRFLVARPILQALAHSPAVLLIDEIDRADDEFEAFLLEVLADNAVTIPELGTIRAVDPPLAVITSNRTREVHDALKRRCLYHWVAHPDFAREVAIVRRRIPDAAQRLVEEVAAAVARLRTANLLKPPGVAETIDWTQALHVLGAAKLDPDSAEATLGAALKYREDMIRVQRELGSLLGG